MYINRYSLHNAWSLPCVSFSVTGVVYDEEMLSHENEVSPNHPECPDRIKSIWKELLKEGIIQCCKRVEARKATEDEVLLVHK